MNRNVKRLAGLGAVAAVLALPGTAAATGPTISSLAPSSGPAGTVVSINGTNLQNATAVRFAGVGASRFNALSASRILAVVPAAAVTGPVSLTTPGGTTESGTPFSVTQGIVASPRSVPPGGTFKLSGSGLPPGSSFQVELDGSPIASGHTNSVGGFAGLGVTVPLGVIFGVHEIELVTIGLAISIHILIQADWPFARLDVEGTGDNGWEFLLGTGNVGGLVHKWLFKAAAPVGYSPPVVVGGVEYVGAQDGHVYAVDVFTHKVLWAVQPAGNAFTSPAVAGGTVFIGDGGSLFALDTATGKKLWSFPTSGSYISNPVVSGGAVYFGGFDGTGTSVWALNAGNGKVLWSTQISTTPVIPGAPSLSSTMVFVGDASGSAFALNRSAGTIAWSKNPGGLVEGQPAVFGSSVCFVYTAGGAADVYTYSQASGTKAWSRKINANYVSPAYDSGKLFFVTNSSVIALNASTGATAWSYPSVSTFDDTSVAVANGVAYATVGGRLVALNETTGAGLFSSPTSYIGPISSPVVVNGRIYFGDHDGNVHVFGL